MSQKQWAAGAFSGEGSTKGRRWNHKDIPAVYLSEHLSLAALEIIVNAPRKLLALSFVYFKVDIPATVKIATLEALPHDWKDIPYPFSTRDIGTEWFRKGESAVLKVPSVIVPDEYNYIINPLHPDFKKIIIGHVVDFFFDQRMTR